MVPHEQPEKKLKLVPKNRKTVDPASLSQAPVPAVSPAQLPVPLAGGAGRGGLEDLWNSTTAAEDPLPNGDYVAHAVIGTYFRSSKDGQQGYEVEFAVLDGEHAGRHFTHTFWLTKDSLKYSMRDLAKIGITQYHQLHEAIPQGRVVDVHVVIHVTDKGGRYNRIVEMEYLRSDPSLAQTE